MAYSLPWLRRSIKGAITAHGHVGQFSSLHSKTAMFRCVNCPAYCIVCTDPSEGEKHQQGNAIELNCPVHYLDHDPDNCEIEC